MGCPLTYIAERPAASQLMQSGEMLWVDLNDFGNRAIPATMARRFIYTIDQPGLRYERYVDTWIAGVDPMLYDLEPPASGLYAPWGGFGKLWINDSNVRNAMQWAIEPRGLESTADIVIFDNIYNDLENLGMMVLFKETSTVYAFGRRDRPEEVWVAFPR
jgi:hypothetical protein